MLSITLRQQTVQRQIVLSANRIKLCIGFTTTLFMTRLNSKQFGRRNQYQSLQIAPILFRDIAISNPSGCQTFAIHSYMLQGVHLLLP